MHTVVMWKVILLYVFVGITTSELTTYENYKLLRITPRTQTQVNTLKTYYRFSHTTWMVDFWNKPCRTDAYVNILVSPDNVNWFQEIMTGHNMDFEYLKDNVQTLINETTKEGQSSSFDFTSYHTLEKIYKNLDVLAEMYPGNVKIIVGGSTYEGRQIKGVKISFKPNNPGVFLEGGINAREWMTPAVVMYIMHQLLTSNVTKIRNMAESNDWYIFPVFNPDGYVYTQTTDRMWTKTLKLYNNYIGSNPNRNWGYIWPGWTLYSEANTFAGPEPFSEIETKSMSEYIQTINDKFFAYFSFHSQSFDVTYPPDDITNNTMQYELDMMDIAGKSFNVPYLMAGSSWQWTRPKVYKNVVKTSDLDRGSSIRYIKGTYNTPLVLAYGIQDKYSSDGFLQSPALIVWFGEEVIYGLDSMLNEAKRIFSITNIK